MHAKRNVMLYWMDLIVRWWLMTLQFMACLPQQSFPSVFSSVFVWNLLYSVNKILETQISLLSLYEWKFWYFLPWRNILEMHRNLRGSKPSFRVSFLPRAVRKFLLTISATFILINPTAPTYLYHSSYILHDVKALWMCEWSSYQKKWNLHWCSILQ